MALGDVDAAICAPQISCSLMSFKFKCDRKCGCEGSELFPLELSIAA